MKQKDKIELWDREKFKEILNERLPLTEHSSLEDKRRSDEWTERKIRTYFSGKSALPEPIKEGKKVFYTEKHLVALKELLNIQEIGLSYKSSSSLYSSLSKSVEEQLPEVEVNSRTDLSNKEDILSLLNGMKNENTIESNVVSRNVSGSSLIKSSGDLNITTKGVSDILFESFNKYKIGNDIEISIKNNMNIENVKRNIQDWLNNLK